MGVTIVIVVATCIVSFLAFSNQRLVNDLIFYPIAVAEQKQWYRFFSCGLIPRLDFGLQKVTSLQESKRDFLQACAHEGPSQADILVSVSVFAL